MIVKMALFNARFQHTAARRRLRPLQLNEMTKSSFQHTAARRRLHMANFIKLTLLDVSTHSRPKAAAHAYEQIKDRKGRFNTQPPEGGCAVVTSV